jgi:hypothetical protein
MVLHVEMRQFAGLLPHFKTTNVCQKSTCGSRILNQLDKLSNWDYSGARTPRPF